MTNAVPFEATLTVRDTCLCLHVQRAARALARRFDRALKPVGLTHAQFSLLMALNRPEPAAMPELATLLGTDRTTLTAALKRLGARGLVEVLVDPQDRRGRRVTLTGAGGKILAQALPVWAEAHAGTQAQIGDPARFKADLQALSD